MLYLNCIFIMEDKLRKRRLFAMLFQTAIFDLDGTLLNTLADLTDAVNHMLSENGYPLRSEREIRRFLGNGAKILITKSLPQGTDEETVNRCLKEYLAWYGPHAGIKTGPYEGIPALLQALNERGVKMAVVSNKGDDQVKDLCRKYFPEISVAIGEREGVRRKPCPDSVLEAIKELGADPTSAIFMGDSEVDAETAIQANLPFVAVSWGFRDKEELTAYHPVKLLEHPLDLLEGNEI